MPRVTRACTSDARPLAAPPRRCFANLSLRAPSREIPSAHARSSRLPSPQRPRPARPRPRAAAPKVCQAFQKGITSRFVPEGLFYNYVIAPQMRFAREGTICLLSELSGRVRENAVVKVDAPVDFRATKRLKP